MDHELDRESVDSQAARLLTVWGQRSSRRGLLAIVGKFALRLAGLSMLPLLPVDRAFAAVGACASDWRLCGMWGRFCKDCCNQTASLYNCPTCTLQGSFWSFCCCHNVNCSTVCETISYFDCCGTASGFTDAQAQACTDTSAAGLCTRNPAEQPIWCGNAPAIYRCTTILESFFSC